MGEIITSLQNYKVKQAVKLREAKGRKETGLMIIEGRKELSLAKLLSGYLKGKPFDSLRSLRVNQKSWFKVQFIRT